MIYPICDQSFTFKNNLSTSKVDRIFDLFRKIAFNWSEEGIGRLYYKFYATKPDAPKTDKYPKILDTYCTVTSEVLLIALFELSLDPLQQFKLSASSKKFSITTPFTKTFASIFFNNCATSLKNKDFHFTCHLFTIKWNECGHAFLVVQYLNITQEPRFRIFQSFLDNYSLSFYLGESDEILSLSEFLKITSDLASLFQRRTCDTGYIEICQRLFHNPPEYKLGENNDTQMDIYFQTGSLNTVEMLLAQFNAFKSQSPKHTFAPSEQKAEWTIFNNVDPEILGEVK